MLVARNILLVLHIISAGIWIAQFPVEIFFRRMRKQAEGTPRELTILTTMLQLMGGMGQIGGMGVLITGLGLIGVSGLGFLGLGAPTPTWLFIKQVIYLILLAMVFTLIRSASEKMGVALEKAQTSNGVVTPEIRSLTDRVSQIALAHNALVLVNIVLAVWKMPQ
jgi:hypothetical protein